MPTELSVHAHLVGKIRLEGTAHTGDSVNIDYPAPIGEDQGLMPLELLLLSLAGCSGHTVLLLLRKMHQPIESLAVEAVGTRRDEHRGRAQPPVPLERRGGSDVGAHARRVAAPLRHVSSGHVRYLVPDVSAGVTSTGSLSQVLPRERTTAAMAGTWYRT